MASPGSAGAKRLGCTCPALDNSYGEGAIIEGHVDHNQFFVARDCPIHINKERLNVEPGGGVGNRGVALIGTDDYGDLPVPGDQEDSAGPQGEAEPTGELQGPVERHSEGTDDRGEET